MPTSIAFGNWTHQGARTIACSPERLDGAKRQLGETGGSFADVVRRRLRARRASEARSRHASASRLPTSNARRR